MHPQHHQPAVHPLDLVQSRMRVSIVRRGGLAHAVHVRAQDGAGGGDVQAGGEEGENRSQASRSRQPFSVNPNQTRNCFVSSSSQLPNATIYPRALVWAKE